MLPRYAFAALLAAAVPLAAHAAQPLTDKQLDRVTAGWDGSGAGFFSSVLSAIAANPGASSSTSTSSSP